MQLDGTSNVHVHIQAQLRLSAVVKQVQSCTYSSCSCERRTYSEPHDMAHIVAPCSADGCRGYNTCAKLTSVCYKMRQDIVGKKLCSNEILKETSISKAARSNCTQYHNAQNF